MITTVDTVDTDHLIDDHGIARSLVRRWNVKEPDKNAKRLLSLQLEMRHAADHAQRKVGHEHT